MSYKYRISERKVQFIVVQVNEHSTILVSDNTFANCQNFTIGCFNNFLNNTRRDERKQRLKEIKTLCRISKPLLIVDVNSGYVTNLKKDFHVVESMPYKSTNGNRMCLVIIDTRR